MSAGTIIESMSSRKLTYMVVLMFLFQVLSFFLGAVVSPQPNYAEPFTGTKCISPEADMTSKNWYYPRGKGKCKSVESFDNIQDKTLTAENIVFSFQMPHMKEGVALEYSRWQQTLIGILYMDIAYQEEEEHEPRIQLMMKAKLGYRNKGDAENDWKLLDESFVYRNLDCSIDPKNKQDGFNYDCSMLSLFELGSLHHDYYLLNIWIPSVFKHDGEEINIQGKLGKLTDVTLISIIQNGGFTKVWVALKTIFFPIILVEMIWYWRRIQQLPRDSTLLERMLFALGCAVTLLNLPLEYLTLFFDMPWLVLFNDMKQGYFYANLMVFWLIFTGEHCINDTGDTGEKNGLRAYWKKLSVILFGCTCLFLFDICERGIQLHNSFSSIWSTDVGTNLALGFIILAGVSAGMFFLYLCYMIYRVSMALKQKQSSISAMPTVRRLHYTGIIWRFRFLQLATLVTAALTSISFILGRVSEGQYKWDENLTLQCSSGFQTGVFGMWNIYIGGLIFLYAPSHKNWPVQRSANDTDNIGNNGEEIEFSVQRGASSDASELSSLTEFMRHQATD